ncbi:Gfo/Idh/MocA family oxidoreductase [Sphaerochaeta sp.]|uniref:Gfo/Idh/MocA family oxidoreductase n=1 Tax=Sphaerochaeta sp. TaxID=1972642 RepID=UPI003D0EFAFA
MKENIWVVGAGPMAQDYVKVLQGLKRSFTVIGRGEENSAKCAEKTGCAVISGGLEKFLGGKPLLCSHAIVAVGVEKLYETTCLLLEYGVKNILLEKPGALFSEQFDMLASLTDRKSADVLIAYNRRFYTAVKEARKIIEDDGGVTSFNFEFTEWAHVIEPLQKAEGVKENWFLCNSTHVVDLAFFLGGKPKNFCAFISGGLDWHPSSSVFSGAGVSENGALFCYQANWESAGRWSVEVLTKEHRLVFRPMEKLQIQKRGSVSLEFADIDYVLDTDYKPGLYLQTERFLKGDKTDMCTFKEQYEMYRIYKKMVTGNV